MRAIRSRYSSTSSTEDVVAFPDQLRLLDGRDERELHRGEPTSVEVARAGLEPATPRFSAVCSTS